VSTIVFFYFIARANAAPGKSCLIIWDNVETQYLIRPYLSVAPASASMLVTTRYPEEAILLRSRGPIIHLQPFSAPEAALFFTQLLGTDYVQMQDLEDRKATEILLGKMAGLAIGICTMAIRIKAKGLSVRSFLNRYRKGTLVSKRAELADYDLTLESIWDESFSSMKSEEDEGENKGFSMLGVLMFCSSDRISKDLFVRPSVNGLADFPKFCQDSDALSLPCALGLEWELKLYRYLEAMDPLRKHGLITADQDFRVVAIHRLVQSALRKFLGLEASQACFNLAARLVHRAFPERIEGHSLHSQWDDCRSFIQHGVSLADIYEDSQSTPHPLSAPPEFTDLLKSCIWYV
jgi:hypothetical protein